MSLPKKDIIATVLVAVAAVVYLLWEADAALPGMDGTRATGLVVLALGFVASAMAVVPGFDQLLHGSRAYLAGSSLLGVVAFVAGCVMLVSASEAALTVVICVMVLLWAVATTRHALLAGPRAPRRHGSTRPMSGGRQPILR